MKDRYLFKAQRADNGEWVQGNILLDIEKNKPSETYRIYPIDHVDICRIVDETTICQCTGLKDKNGNLIWEKDVVDFFGHKGVIVCECGSFGIAYKNFLYACENDNYISLREIYWNFYDGDDLVDTMEVIGNIFDNPELLESEG